jgi:hypothetical protein
MKAHNALDREHTITILKGYGTGVNLLLDTMVPKQAGFEPKTWSLARRHLISIIFHILKDAVIRWVYATAEVEGNRRRREQQH